MFSDPAVQPHHAPEAARPGRLVVELVSWIIAHTFGLVDGSQDSGLPNPGWKRHPSRRSNNLETVLISRMTTRSNGTLV